MLNTKISNFDARPITSVKSDDELLDVLNSIKHGMITFFQINVNYMNNPIFAAVENKTGGSGILLATKNNNYGTAIFIGYSTNNIIKIDLINSSWGTWNKVGI